MTVPQTYTAMIRYAIEQGHTREPEIHKFLLDLWGVNMKRTTLSVTRGKILRKMKKEKEQKQSAPSSPTPLGPKNPVGKTLRAMIEEAWDNGNQTVDTVQAYIKAEYGEVRSSTSVYRTLGYIKRMKLGRQRKPRAILPQKEEPVQESPQDRLNFLAEELVKTVHRLEQDGHEVDLEPSRNFLGKLTGFDITTVKSVRVKVDKEEQKRENKASSDVSN